MARVGSSPSALIRLTPEASALFLVGATLWVAVVYLATNMGFMPGTMGLGLPTFIGVWALMMTAMMLPTVAPVAAAYTRSFTDRRKQRLAIFASGYLAVWAGSGVPAFGGAILVDHLAGVSPLASHAVAAGALVGVAIFQLTPLKRMCLEYCRSPLVQLLHYAGYRGKLCDLRVGIHHGGFCLSCCWSLMLLLIALGTMNVFIMLGLVLFILIEKYTVRGEAASRSAAVIAVALAVVAVTVPQAGIGAPPMSM